MENNLNKRLGYANSETGKIDCMVQEFQQKYNDENRKMRQLILKELKKGLKLYRQEKEYQMNEKQKELNELSFGKFQKIQKLDKQQHTIIRINTKGFEEEYDVSSEESDDDTDTRDEKAAHESQCQQLQLEID